IDNICQGKHISKFIHKSPMRGALLAIQQTRRAEKKGTNTKTCDLCTAIVLFYDPGYKFAIKFRSLFLIAMQSGNKDHVCFCHIFHQNVGLNREQTAGLISSL